MTEREAHLIAVHGCAACGDIGLVSKQAPPDDSGRRLEYRVLCDECKEARRRLAVFILVNGRDGRITGIDMPP